MSTWPRAFHRVPGEGGAGIAFHRGRGEFGRISVPRPRYLVAGGTRRSESGASDARSQVHHGGDTCLQGGAAVPGRYGLGGRGMGAGARGLPLPLPAFLQCSLGTCWAPGSAWMPGVMGSWRTACASPRGLTIDPEMDLTP